jgi:hypothetical protein
MEILTDDHGIHAQAGDQDVGNESLGRKRREIAVEGDDHRTIKPDPGQSLVSQWSGCQAEHRLIRLEELARVGIKGQGQTFERQIGRVSGGNGTGRLDKRGVTTMTPVEIADRHRPKAMIRSLRDRRSHSGIHQQDPKTLMDLFVHYQPRLHIRARPRLDLPVFQPRMPPH